MDKTPHSKRSDFFWSGKKRSDFINLFIHSFLLFKLLAEEVLAAGRLDFLEEPVRFAPVREGFHFRGNLEHRWNEALNERNSIRREQQ